jgi:hypothetical protein
MIASGDPGIRYERESRESHALNAIPFWIAPIMWKNIGVLSVDAVVGVDVGFSFSPDRHGNSMAVGAIFGVKDIQRQVSASGRCGVGDGFKLTRTQGRVGWTIIDLVICYLSSVRGDVTQDQVLHTPSIITGIRSGDPAIRDEQESALKRTVMPIHVESGCYLAVVGVDFSVGRQTQASCG